MQKALVTFLILLPTLSFTREQHLIRHFQAAKRIGNEIFKEYPYTLYCHCKFKGKAVDLASCGYEIQKDASRARQIEWEHIVPAEAFGNSFSEWREGSPLCVKKGKRYRGRKCAEKNPEYSGIESDLYNLWPEVGELNGLRQNFSMAELGAEQDAQGQFGGCRAKIQDRKFEPGADAKGRVARTYLYMDQAYPGRGIISEKNRPLFEAWDKLHPVDDWECRRAEKIESAQGNKNPILLDRCKVDSDLKSSPVSSHNPDPKSPHNQSLKRSILLLKK